MGNQCEQRCECLKQQDDQKRQEQLMTQFKDRKVKRRQTAISVRRVIELQENEGQVIEEQKLVDRTNTTNNNTLKNSWEISKIQVTVPQVDQQHQLGHSGKQQTTKKKGQKEEAKQSEKQEEVTVRYEQKKEVPVLTKSKKCFQDFCIPYILGFGSFGRVFLGCLIDKGNSQKSIFAIKQMQKSWLHEKKLIDNIILERDLMRSRQSNFITKVYWSFQDQYYYYLVMEWAKAGDVFSFIRPQTERFRRFKKVGEEAVRFILGCVILGLEHLHSKRIVYNDLKPQNLLVFQDGYIKLTDFGLSKQLTQNKHWYIKAGTQTYFAPEIILERQCGRYVDLWALGVVAYQLVNYHLPFQLAEIKNKQIFLRVANSGQKRWASSVSTDLKMFVEGLLKVEPRVRLGASGWDKIKAHCFFNNANFDWEALQNKTMPSPLLRIIKKTPFKLNKINEMSIRPIFNQIPLPTQIHQKLQNWSCASESQA